MQTRGRQDAEEFGAGQEYPLPPVQISYRSLAGYPAKTPLAAGLAASAGGLGSSEALAVHPWAQEFLYAANYFGALAGSGPNLNCFSIVF